MRLLFPIPILFAVTCWYQPLLALTVLLPITLLGWFGYVWYMSYWTLLKDNWPNTHRIYTKNRPYEIYSRESRGGHRIRPRTLRMAQCPVRHLSTRPASDKPPRGHYKQNP